VCTTAVEHCVLTADADREREREEYRRRDRSRSDEVRRSKDSDRRDYDRDRDRIRSGRDSDRDRPDRSRERDRGEKHRERDDRHSKRLLSAFILHVSNCTARFCTDPGKVWKVVEFNVKIFKVLKSLESEFSYGKVWKTVI